MRFNMCTHKDVAGIPLRQINDTCTRCCVSKAIEKLNQGHDIDKQDYHEVLRMAEINPIKFEIAAKLENWPSKYIKGLKD